MYIQAEKQLKAGKAMLQGIRSEWMKIRGAAVKQEFDRRAASSPAEQEIAQRMGETSYLEKLNLAQSIAQKNGFNSLWPPKSSP